MRLNHGLIGNGRLLALIAPDSSVDWLCLPRFDSSSIFARLLDEQKGGFWRVEPVQPSTSSQSYIRNTNVLVTRIETADGEIHVVDFAPWIDLGYQMEAPLQLIRVLVPVRGVPRIRVLFSPAPNYARTAAQYVMRTKALEVRGHECPLELFSDIPIDFILQGVPVSLERPRYLALCAEGEIGSTETALHLRDQTVWSWTNWAKSCAVPDYRPERVVRSALCLKLHQYSPTGAIIAATTTSIPEELNTERTWDYRYCWLRDSALVVEALRRLGCISEGERFLMYLRDVAELGPLQPVYGVGAERLLTEVTLSHLSGFRAAGPVRMGNAAFSQVQHDVMGELILSMRSLLSDPRTTTEATAYWPLVQRLVSDARAALFQSDSSIWEERSEASLHTFSQAMCWAAIHTGAQIADSLGRKERSAEWRDEATRVHHELLKRSYSPQLEMFTDALEGRHADASNLLLAAIGFIPASSVEFQNTLTRYAHELVRDGLMQRYRHADDFGTPRSAFTTCSFWWAEALAIAGRLDEALEVFERLLAYSNELGLFSEDIDPATGEMLGNYPQAYTHVGLINAAVTIGHLKAAREGKVAPWK